VINESAIEKNLYKSIASSPFFFSPKLDMGLGEEIFDDKLSESFKHAMHKAELGKAKARSEDLELQDMLAKAQLSSFERLTVAYLYNYKESMLILSPVTILFSILALASFYLDWIKDIGVILFASLAAVCFLMIIIISVLSCIGLRVQQRVKNSLEQTSN